MATPEGRIKAKLDRMLKKYPAVWRYSPQAGPHGAAGVPDRLLCVYGLLVGVEVKSGPDKKPTVLQSMQMERIEEAGGKCFVVHDDETVAIVENFIVGRAAAHRVRGK